MTTRGMPLRFVTDRHKPGSIWSFGPASWIPAFAGMTEEAGMTTKIACVSIPSIVIQVGLLQAGRNDGGVAVRHLSGMAKGLSGWQPAFSLLVVIPAKAGIQWFT